MVEEPFNFYRETNHVQVIKANRLFGWRLCSHKYDLGASKNLPNSELGITTFLSGPASVFGVPAKAAAEIVIDDINAKGGIGGVKISASFIDEGLGADPLLLRVPSFGARPRRSHHAVRHFQR
jgi:hypothetical protein